MWSTVTGLWPFWLLLAVSLTERYWHPGRTLARLVRRG